ncbi:hypothetical protein VCRA2122O339_140056 [Vibrio crassostreae]|nr:hypothetical protein VCRA2120E331_150056 [Vibrio crassostreae]CAK3219792.1 hypothetical protein VCRA2127O345_150056 [Vibrio crassostreae]CAK3240881.1 hypothetical protein VCRA2122O339_140056 [Vibrio crassostreae]CAK3243865.1 hypothetical protein VCRA2120E330_160057 [Vibrio crassostreae]CAK3259427.1 hypothetical protein VCRA2122O338_150075 [Vibrio crassostreae]
MGSLLQILILPETFDAFIDNTSVNLLVDAIEILPLLKRPLTPSIDIEF